MGILVPYTNLDTRCFSRGIEDVFTVVHHLWHAVTSNRYSTCTSLRQYRDNASRRQPFLQTIMKMRKHYFIENGRRQVTGIAETLDFTSPTFERHPLNTRSSQLVPTYLTPSTGSTPTTKRKLDKLLESETDSITKKRLKTCPGMVVYLNLTQGERRNCMACRKYKTRWYCIGCKAFLCNEQPEKGYE